MVQIIEIDSEQAGRRIDNYLMAHFGGVPRSHIYRILRTGQVRANGGRIRPDYRVKEGDRIRIPPLRLPQSSTDAKVKAPLPAKLIAQIKQSILFEDDGLLVINKPSGLAVHGGSGIAFGLIEVLREIYPEVPNLALVHRLDRETSGCLLVAKRRAALLAMHTLLREAKMQKQYLALISPGQTTRVQKVDKPLLKHSLQGGERMVRVDAAGKQALTTFTAIEQFPDATLMKVAPHTGRTHQIRVHAASLGSPVLGDAKYGDAQRNKQFRKLGLKRLFLHAHRLHFYAPTSEQWVQVEAVLPEVLTQCLQHIRAAAAS